MAYVYLQSSEKQRYLLLRLLYAGNSTVVDTNPWIPRSVCNSKLNSSSCAILRTPISNRLKLPRPFRKVWHRHCWSCLVTSHQPLSRCAWNYSGFFLSPTLPILQTNKFIVWCFTFIRSFPGLPTPGPSKLESWRYPDVSAGWNCSRHDWLMFATLKFVGPSQSVYAECSYHT